MQNASIHNPAIILVVEEMTIAIHPEKETEYLLVIATPAVTTSLAMNPTHEAQFMIVGMQIIVTVHDLVDNPVRGVRVTMGVLGAVAATVTTTLVMFVTRSRRVDCESAIPTTTATQFSLHEF